MGLNDGQVVDLLLREEVRSYTKWREGLTKKDGSLNVVKLKRFSWTAATQAHLGYNDVHAFYEALWRGGKSAARITWPSLGPKGQKRREGGQFKATSVAQRVEDSSARAMLVGDALIAAKRLLGYCVPLLTGEWAVRVCALRTNC